MAKRTAAEIRAKAGTKTKIKTKIRIKTGSGVQETATTAADCLKYYCKGLMPVCYYVPAFYI